jgi:hypothetical protein
MNERKPWQPRMREEPIFNPFEPSTDWTRDVGANDQVEIPDEEEDEGTQPPDQDTGEKGGKPASK